MLLPQKSAEFNHSEKKLEGVTEQPTKGIPQRKNPCKGFPSESHCTNVNNCSVAHLIVILGLQEAKQNKASECQCHTNAPEQKLLHLDGRPGALPQPLVHHVEELWKEVAAALAKFND